MNLPAAQPESLSPRDPRDYRGGILFSWLLVIYGIFSGILFAVFGFTRLAGLRNIGSTAASSIWIALFIFCGLSLARKGKLGLWLLYVISAFIGEQFVSSTIDSIMAGRRDDIYRVILNSLWLIVWISIARYFHNRRQQFTGFWRSTETNPSAKQGT